MGGRKARYIGNDAQSIPSRHLRRGEAYLDAPALRGGQLRQQKACATPEICHASVLRNEGSEFVAIEPRAKLPDRALPVEIRSPCRPLVVTGNVTFGQVLSIVRIDL